MVAVMATVGGRARAQEAKTPPRPAAKPAAAPAGPAKPAAVAATKPAAAESAPTAPVGPLSPPAVPYRKLVPGVFQNIVEQTPLGIDTVTTHNVTELIAIDPKFTWAEDVPFHRDVWMLEFKFKPMRMIWVDVPGTEGRMQRKLIWYLLYTVTNPGKLLHQVEGEDKTFHLELVDRPIRFIPVFTLEVHNRLQDEAAGSAKVYDEKYVPVALGAIRGREDPHRQFRSSVEMARQEIAVGDTVWGIATWEDIDPRNVWFSVYVDGLTNAYRWKDDPAKYATDGRGYRSMFRKVLKLNFWRPGDEFSQKETQIRYGVPGQPEYEWVWRRVL